MNPAISTMTKALRFHSHGNKSADEFAINACCGNAADMLVQIDARQNTAIMALRAMIDGGEEMRGYDSQIRVLWRLKNILETWRNSPIL